MHFFCLFFLFECVSDILVNLILELGNEFMMGSNNFLIFTNDGFEFIDKQGLGLVVEVDGQGLRCNYRFVL